MRLAEHSANEGIPSPSGIVRYRGGAADQIVCVAALNDGAILVAADHDMKGIARANGAGAGRFKSLSLIKLSCRKPEAAEKIRGAMSLIEHEWQCDEGDRRRRIWIVREP